MLSKIFNVFRKLLLSAERDRFENRFDEISDKFEEFDERIDDLKIGQSEIKAEIKASNEINLANLETMEQKMNRNITTAESVREIVDARLTGFQESMRTIQRLIEQIIKRDCNLS